MEEAGDMGLEGRRGERGWEGGEEREWEGGEGRDWEGTCTRWKETLRPRPRPCWSRARSSKSTTLRDELSQRLRSPFFAAAPSSVTFVQYCGTRSATGSTQPRSSHVVEALLRFELLDTRPGVCDGEGVAVRHALSTIRTPLAANGRRQTCDAGQKPTVSLIEPLEVTRMAFSRM
eukprot:768317-Hanusia_phi.AAC.5